MGKAMTMPRANSMFSPKKVYSEVEQGEYDMLRQAAKVEDRPMKELIRYILREWVQMQVHAGKLAPVEGYVAPNQAVTTDPAG